MPAIDVILLNIKNGPASRYFPKALLKKYFTAQAATGAVPEEELSLSFDDVFSFGWYLDRIDDYDRIEDVPFWEYSTALFWMSTHVLSGDSFEITYANAKRIFDHLDEFYSYLKERGKIVNKTELNRARKAILKGKKVVLIEEADIPYTGAEVWRKLVKNGKETVFYIYDKWLLLLLDMLEYDWQKLKDAAGKARGEKPSACAELQDKMSFLGVANIRQISMDELFVSDVERALDWFCGGNELLRASFGSYQK